MKEIRCPKCKKLILKGKGKAELEIKCSRCSNVFVTKLATVE